MSFELFLYHIGFLCVGLFSGYIVGKAQRRPARTVNVYCVQKTMTLPGTDVELLWTSKNPHIESFRTYMSLIKKARDEVVRIAEKKKASNTTQFAESLESARTEYSRLVRSSELPENPIRKFRDFEQKCGNGIAINPELIYPLL